MFSLEAAASNRVGSSHLLLEKLLVNSNGELKAIVGLDTLDVNTAAGIPLDRLLQEVGGGISGLFRYAMSCVIRLLVKDMALSRQEGL